MTLRARPQPQYRVDPALTSEGGVHYQETQEGIIKGGVRVRVSVSLEGIYLLT